MSYAFSGRRYMTAGVQHSIDLALQIFIWNLIDQLIQKKEVQPDYLQIFDLSTEIIDGKTLQKIVHRQEEPLYLMTYRVSIPTPIQKKLYVIDDVDHITMLLAEEY